MTSSIDLKALSIFVNTPITQDMIHKLVVTTLQVLPCQDSKNQTYTAAGDEKPLPSLMTFLTKLVRYTNVYTGTLMATLVYLNKLKSKLPKNAQGLPCTRHRILLSCLILSSKFHNDSSPKNVHWAKYTDGLFTTKDINLMERQLLYLLNWDLRVENDDMIRMLDSFLDPIRYDLVKSTKMRKYLSKRKEEQDVHHQKYLHQLQVPSQPMSPESLQSLSPQQQQQHYRQLSSSSISSMASSVMDGSSSRSSISSPTPQVDPIIEMTAQKEEIELNKLLQRLNSSHKPVPAAY